MTAPKLLFFAVAIATTTALVTPAASFAKSAVTAPKPAAVKHFTIVGLDNGLTFTAQFNPKEIRVEKPVPWSKAPSSRGDQPELQFTSAQGRSMSFELMFDTYEARTDVHSGHVAKLMALAMVMDPSASAPEDKKRPPRVKVQWGPSALKFEGVIESIDVKYTMFLSDGTPVRATCAVKLKEASRASFKK